MNWKQVRAIIKYVSGPTDVILASSLHICLVASLVGGVILSAVCFYRFWFAQWCHLALCRESPATGSQLRADASLTSSALLCQWVWEREPSAQLFPLGICCPSLNVSANGLETLIRKSMRAFDVLCDRRMAYSGSRRGCSPSNLGGSARSNDPQPPGGMDSCGWEGGRWNGWRPGCIRTSDSPGSWRNPSSPPRLHERKGLLDPSICLFLITFKCFVHCVNDESGLLQPSSYSPFPSVMITSCKLKSLLGSLNTLTLLPQCIAVKKPNCSHSWTRYKTWCSWMFIKDP